ncbi:MAG: hypothetical protein KJ556_19985 [Gammaproteobacteria bacterium]|nr:hypothetical protein [Gammaproteobacteria bacterium]MBU2058653.1 hypothetical protein [Gammaproteobacteria bacterium]MBU2177381.1 hypothetical protein [Gammaproteobacteria bacterium]MBU2246398.1 hypothetical protein [Gammaproteobacteria bacterium]MBU2344541.1 hypothetical protein [Gammaproteobacteria bacterium]
MNTQDSIQLPGLRQLLSAFIVLVLILLAFDSTLEWLSFNLQQQPFVAPELLLPMSWLAILF